MSSSLVSLALFVYVIHCCARSSHGACVYQSKSEPGEGTIKCSHWIGPAEVSQECANRNWTRVALNLRNFHAPNGALRIRSPQPVGCLEKLRLHHSNFTTIFMDTALPHLSFLASHGGQLTEFPTFTHQLQHLTEISLRGNKLAELNMQQNSTTNLRALKTLDLSSNVITRISSYALTMFTALEILDLSDNRISIMSNKTFTALTRLRFLNLEKNRLQVIPSNMLMPLKQLARLNLGGNRLSALQAGMLAGPMKIDLVDVKANPVRYVEHDFIKLKRNTSVEIDSQNLTCNCKLKWLRHLADHLGLRFARTLTKARCQEPAYLKGRLFSEVPPTMFTCVESLTPVITKQPQPVVAQSGNITQVDCQVRVPQTLGNVDKIHVNWYKDGHKLNGMNHQLANTGQQERNRDAVDSSSASWKFGSGQGGTRSNPGRFLSVVRMTDKTTSMYKGILIIQNTSLRDAGLYSCMFDTPRGKVASIQAKLTVEEPVRITHISSAQSVRSGDSLQLHCSVRGFPLPNVHWNFQSSSFWLQHLRLADLMQISKTKVADLNKAVQLGQATVSVYFPHVDSRHDGTFLCKAGDESRASRLTVAEKPQIQNVLFKKQHTVLEGEMATLVCNASGTLPLKFEWRHSLYREPLPEREGILQIITAGSQSMMIIARAAAKHTAKYECTVTNKYGGAMEEQHLHVKTLAEFCSTKGNPVKPLQTEKPPFAALTSTSLPCQGNSATNSHPGSLPSEDDSFRLPFFVTISLLVIIMLVVIVIGLHKLKQPSMRKQT